MTMTNDNDNVCLQDSFCLILTVHPYVRWCLSDGRDNLSRDDRIGGISVASFGTVSGSAGSFIAVREVPSLTPHQEMIRLIKHEGGVFSLLIIFKWTKYKQLAKISLKWIKCHFKECHFGFSTNQTIKAITLNNNQYKICIVYDKVKLNWNCLLILESKR